MTEAMPFLRNTILLSYDPRSFAPGFLHDSPSGNRKAAPGIFRGGHILFACQRRNQNAHFSAI